MYREPAPRPNHRLPLLDRFTKRTPCKASWSDMVGDDRVRLCGACRKNVYDVTAMSEDEAEGFLAHHLDDQEACVRLYRRPDGRLLTSDCPRGADRRHVRRVGLAVCVASGALVAVSAALAELPVPRTHHLPGSTARFEVPRAPAPTPAARDYDVDPPRPRPIEPTPWDDEVTFRTWPLPAGVDPLDTRVPHARTGAVVARNMAATAVAHIVRTTFGPFLRACYEDALRVHPALQGSITVDFEIDRDGRVRNAEERDSDIPDAPLVACVVKAVAQLWFPRPEEGSAFVTLPLHLHPPE